MSLSLQLLRRRASGFRSLIAATSSSRTLSSSKSQNPADPKTHTGQAFEKDDYRLVRFTDKEKQVNTRFAIELIAEAPPTEKKSRVVYCDGGGGPLGHPKVYINLDVPGNHSCGYCGLRFYKDDHHHH